MANCLDVRKALKAFANKEKAALLSGYFKTGKGEYGEGDIFMGVVVPDSRQVAKKYRDMSWGEVTKLLKSQYHEERFVTLVILCGLFGRGDLKAKTKIYEHYMNSTKYINNWDLVDSSARFIPGPFLERQNKKPLVDFAKSRDLWKRRISVIATFPYIRSGNFDTTFKVADILLKDDQDLIQKAVGWMLREVGNMNRRAEVKYLEKHYRKMPRTMLRYAIEKFPMSERIRFLT